jgi:hypothetical protein
MATNLLNRAYVLHKQGAEAHRSMSIAQLQAEFPAAAMPEIEAAFASAGRLIDAACEWAEQLRGPANDGKGVPTMILSERCPGFSQGTYSDAESWGLYLTK